MSRSTDPNRARRRRKKLYLLFVGGFMIWFIAAYFQQMNKIDEKYQDLAELQAKLSTVKEKHAKLQAEIRRLHDPEYVLQMERKDLHMTKENEIKFELHGSQ